MQWLISYTILYGALHISFTDALSSSARERRSTGSSTYRIYGGEEVTSGREYVVSFRLYENEEWQNYCGGSLIAPEWVLTAAHCVDPTYLKEDELWIGGLSESEPNGFEKMKASKWECHESFDPSIGVDNDICLIKLKKASTKATVKVNTSPSNEVSGTHAVVTGFGRIVDDETTQSSTLLIANAPILPDSDCTSAYGSEFKSADMLCAGIADGSEDACKGDSGSALVTDDNVQVGIVSWGSGCGNPGLYTVYVRVSAYYDWIANITGTSVFATSENTTSIQNSTDTSTETEDNVTESHTAKVTSESGSTKTLSIVSTSKSASKSASSTVTDTDTITDETESTELDAEETSEANTQTQTYTDDDDQTDIDTADDTETPVDDTEGIEYATPDSPDDGEVATDEESSEEWDTESTPAETIKESTSDNTHTKSTKSSTHTVTKTTKQSHTTQTDTSIKSTNSFTDGPDEDTNSSSHSEPPDTDSLVDEEPTQSLSDTTDEETEAYPDESSLQSPDTTEYYPAEAAEGPATATTDGTVDTQEDNWAYTTGDFPSATTADDGFYVMVTMAPDDSVSVDDVYGSNASMVYNSPMSGYYGDYVGANLSVNIVSSSSTHQTKTTSTAESTLASSFKVNTDVQHSTLPTEQPSVCNDSCVLFLGVCVQRRSAVVYRIRPVELFGENAGTFPLVSPEGGMSFLAVYEGPNSTVLRVHKQTDSKRRSADTPIKLICNGTGSVSLDTHLEAGQYALDVLSPAGSSGNFWVWLKGTVSGQTASNSTT